MPGVGEEDADGRRARGAGPTRGVLAALFAGAAVLCLVAFGEPRTDVPLAVYAGFAAIALASGVGGYLLFTHAVASSREEQARLDELEARAREEGRRRRAAEAEARAQAEAAKRAAASAARGAQPPSETAAQPDESAAPPDDAGPPPAEDAAPEE